MALRRNQSNCSFRIWGQKNTEKFVGGEVSNIGSKAGACTSLNRTVKVSYDGTHKNIKTPLLCFQRALRRLKALEAGNQAGCYKADPLRHTLIPDTHPPAGRPGRHMATRASLSKLIIIKRPSSKSTTLLNAVFSLEDSSSESYKKVVRIDEVNSRSLR